MKLRTDDTIAAIATPPGTGAISIVRMSGLSSIELADKVFRGKFTIVETPSHTVRHGHAVDNHKELIDEVLVAVFRSPHSYTGENSVEISCHGGSFVTRRLLQSLIDVGARQADPGEFTKRAFLNGKMDLSQAEAVSDLVKASNEMALRNSNSQIRGVLGEKIRLIRERLLHICSLLELELDFSQDEVPITSRKSIESMLVSCLEEIQSSIATYRFGKTIKDGYSVAIVGRPNVGKSSVFNRILLYERSIVSQNPGTTRDFLEESIVIDGIPFRIFDTAGLRVSSDEIEAEGISRTMNIIREADMVVLIVDSADVNSIEEDICAVPSEMRSKTKIVRNKIDLGGSASQSALIRLGVSAITGEGFDQLRDLFVAQFQDFPAEEQPGCFVSSNRHVEALKRTKELVDKSIVSLDSGLTAEFVSMDVRSAIDSISEITGEVTSDEILNSIFSNFCIGK